MTELAHGSNVQGIETTATFDKETDEFVINTPHIGATKWWIGGAAHSATHCTVYARLKVNGKDYGVKTFVVPLRDSITILCQVSLLVILVPRWVEMVLIMVGFTSNVRIPRFNMLQKYAKVSREGEVTMPPSEQLGYSALIGGRVTMMMDSYRMTSRFVTIALRYAIFRRQFKSKISGGDQETKLIDYPLHQKRLFPYLAAAYLFSQGALYLEQTMNETNERLDDAVSEGDKKKSMKLLLLPRNCLLPLVV